MNFSTCNLSLTSQSCNAVKKERFISMEQIITIDEVIAIINSSKKEVIVHVELGEESNKDGEESKNKG